MDALYILSTQSLGYYQLVMLLRGLLKYDTLVVVISGITASLAEGLIKKLHRIFSKLGIKSKEPVILYFDQEIENPESFLEFIKSEIGKIPEVLISDNPEIYRKFYGFMLIDHVDNVKKELAEVLENEH